jgi:altronate dehydratase small subunit
MSGPLVVAGRAWSALVVHPDDDVAVALRDLAAGETIDVRCRSGVKRVGVAEAIPLGHKLALHAIAVGAPIRKYGEPIGTATGAIEAGRHVHVHNLASVRGRTP